MTSVQHSFNMANKAPSGTERRVWSYFESLDFAGYRESATALVPHHTYARKQSPSEQFSPSSIDAAKRVALRHLERSDLDVIHQSSILGMEKWNGRVISVAGDSFTAEIERLDGETPPLLAEFECNLLREEGAPVIAGEFFYLTVRTVGVGVGRTKTAALRRRRLGKWQQEELREIRKRARDRAARLRELVD